MRLESEKSMILFRHSFRIEFRFQTKNESERAFF